MGTLRAIAADTQATETPVTVNAGAITPLCLSNPNRYAIGFAITSGGPARVSINNVGGPGGGFFVPATGIEWIKVKDHAVLAAMAWFETNGSAGTIVTVYEITFPLEG